MNTNSWKIFHCYQHLGFRNINIHRVLNESILLINFYIISSSFNGWKNFWRLLNNRGKIFRVLMEEKPWGKLSISLNVFDKTFYRILWVSRAWFLRSKDTRWANLSSKRVHKRLTCLSLRKSSLHFYFFFHPLLLIMKIYRSELENHKKNDWHEKFENSFDLVFGVHFLQEKMFLLLI